MRSLAHGPFGPAHSAEADYVIFTVITVKPGSLVRTNHINWKRIYLLLVIPSVQSMKVQNSLSTHVNWAQVLPCMKISWDIYLSWLWRSEISKWMNEDSFPLNLKIIRHSISDQRKHQIKQSQVKQTPYSTENFTFPPFFSVNKYGENQVLSFPELSVLL